MALLYLSLGSNIQRHLHIGAALDSLAENFGELIISSVYESESVGFEGDSFYNLVVGIAPTRRLALSQGCSSRLRIKMAAIAVRRDSGRAVWI